MGNINIILTIVLIVLGLVIILLIIFQSGRVRNLGSSIVGTKNIEIFDQKKRGFDKWLHLATILLIILFVALSLTLYFLTGTNNEVVDPSNIATNNVLSFISDYSLLERIGGVS